MQISINGLAAAMATAAFPSIAAQLAERDMEPKRNLQVTRNLIANFFNAHDSSVARTYFAPDLRWHGGSVGEYEGVDNYAKAMAGFWGGFPDAHATELDAIESGDTVAMRLIVEATHLGPLWGIAASGRKVRWNATMVYKVVDGKVTEQWAAEDWAAILHDIGLIVPPWMKK